MYTCMISIAFIYPEPAANGLPGAIPVAPLGITAFFAITISVAIMGVYETAIDTILVSFLEVGRSLR